MTGLITWIPSFEWEDFFASATEDSRAAEMDIWSHSMEKYQSCSSGKKEKQSRRPDKKLKTGSSLDPYANCPAQSFDLNVEPS